MLGDVVQVKKDIFDIRRDMAGPMESLRLGLEGFILDHGFYPQVFYNENDINDSFRGIRMAIPDLDEYPGVFIHQDAPDTPVAGYSGIEFRSSISKSIREHTGAKQLLWTVQDVRNLPLLPASEYDPSPSVQFCGTTVLMENGQPFPQQMPRLQTVYALGVSGLKTQINLKIQQFVQGQFIEVRGQHLSDEGYWGMMQEHPYGLSVRGWGNWDYRFYEMLASGRIPVHIETDDELLFEREIPWDDLIVKVKPGDDLKEKVDAFHSQFSDNKSLAAHQKKLHQIYHDWLSFPAFCHRFEKYYEEELGKWL